MGAQCHFGCPPGMVPWLLLGPVGALQRLLPHECLRVIEHRVLGRELDRPFALCSPGAPGPQQLCWSSCEGSQQ